MATDYLSRFLAGQGMGGRPPLEDDDALLRRFLAAQGRLSDMPSEAPDTAGVQSALAATQLRPQVAPESSPLAPRLVAQKTSPAAAGPTEEEAAYNARRAAASRTAFVNDTLGGVTEGFDRATNLISGINQPIRARNAGGVADAERRFVGSEEERQARERAIRQRPLKEANEAAELAKLQADTEKAKATAAGTTADTAYDAALRDPNSPETQAMRNLAISLSGGKITPELAAQQNGLQLRDGLKLASGQLNAEAMAGVARDRLTQSATQAQFDQQLARWRLGLDREKLDQDWEKFERTEDLKREMDKMRAERAEEKKAFGLAERNVGGFQFVPGAVPSADSAKKLRDVKIEEDKIEFSLKKLKDLYARHGTEIYGTHAGEMEAEFIAISNALRVMNDMGVPNGRDYEMLAKEVADPTVWKDMFTTRGRSQAKLDALGQRVRNTVDSTARASGYERGGRTSSAPMGTMVDVDDLPAGGAQPAPAPPPRPVTKSTAPPPGEIPRIVSTKGMQPGDLLASLADGESVRVAWKDEKTGKAGYQTFQRTKKPNGKSYLRKVGGVE